VQGQWEKSYTNQKTICRSQRGGVLGSEGGSGEEMRNVPSGQIYAIVLLNWPKLRITKDKEPEAPWEGCVFLTPFPTALMACRKTPELPEMSRALKGEEI
jgi:hypothetical protein